jgi:tetrahydromethanopterin S-methyltransferase subunit B
VSDLTTTAAVHNLTSLAGIVAIAAAAVAVTALLGALALALRLRRVRSAQTLVLGERREDLVAHAARIQGQVEALHQYVEDMAGALQDRMDTVEARLDNTIAHRALVHYDAWGEMSGHQSTSIALLDETASGVVLSSIHHRDQARLYAKQVVNGSSERELSPEENEAIRLALGRDGDRAQSA